MMLSQGHLHILSAIVTAIIRLDISVAATQNTEGTVQRLQLLHLPAACAGYGDQKQQIEDTMLLALQHPDVYDKIAKGTRRFPANNKPRAVLFEGPPGTGKTSSAR